jgi:hypothetical protein
MLFMPVMFPAMSLSAVTAVLNKCQEWDSECSELDSYDTIRDHARGYRESNSQDEDLTNCNHMDCYITAFDWIE